MPMHPCLQSLLEYWSARRTGPGLPPRSAFGPFALQPWLGHVSLFEEIDGGRDFRIVLDGTWIVEWTGEDWTGRRTSELDAVYKQGLTGIFRACCDRQEPRIDPCEHLWRKEWLLFDRLILPVWDEAKDAHLLLIGLYPSEATSRSSRPRWHTSSFMAADSGSDAP